MKTFLHYTKEKELDEGFLGDLGREAINRAPGAIKSVGKMAMNVGGKIVKKGLPLARGVVAGAAAGAWSAMKSTDGKMTDAPGAALAAGKEAYKKGKDILDTTKCKAQAALSSRSSRENKEKREIELDTLNKEINTGLQHYSDRGRVVPVTRKDSTGKRDTVKLSPEEIEQRRTELRDAQKEHPLLSKLEGEEAQLKNKKCSVGSTVARFAGLRGDENYERLK
jgi:hypothetical protein